MKKLISLLLVLVLLMSLVPSALADGGDTVTMTCAPELMEIAGRITDGPIHVVKAVLDRGQGNEDVYVLFLCGIQSVIANPNGAPSAAAALFSLPNRYLNMVISVCREQIPAGSKLIIAAHSLGGMVAQQFAAACSMKLRYEILNIVAFGSPFVYTVKREGGLHRLLDVSDPMIHYSITGAHNCLCYASFEDGGYYPLQMEAHTMSYALREVWGEYDCFGVKGGSVTLTYDPADMYVYPYSQYSLILF